MALCYRYNEVERRNQYSYRPPAPAFGMSSENKNSRVRPKKPLTVQYEDAKTIPTNRERLAQIHQTFSQLPTLEIATSLASKLIKDLCVCEEPCTTPASKLGNAVESGETKVKRTAQEIAREHANMLDALVVDLTLFEGVDKFVPLVKPALEEALGIIPDLYRVFRDMYKCLKSIVDRIALQIRENISTALIRKFIATAFCPHDGLDFPSKEREVAEQAANRIVKDNWNVIRVIVRDKVEPLFLADFKLIQGNKIAQIPKSQKSEVREKGDKVFTPLSEPDKGQKLGNTVAFRVQDQALSYVAHDEELHVILEFGEEFGTRGCISRVMGGSCAILVILGVVIVTLLAVTKFG